MVTEQCLGGPLWGCPVQQPNLGQRWGAPTSGECVFACLLMARCSQTTAGDARPAAGEGAAPAGLVAQDVRGGRGALPLLRRAMPVCLLHTGHL